MRWNVCEGETAQGVILRGRVWAREREMEAQRGKERRERERRRERGRESNGDGRRSEERREGDGE